MYALKVMYLKVMYAEVAGPISLICVFFPHIILFI